MDICIVKTTCSTKKEAEEIAQNLIGKKFAACVNIIDNVESFYFWEEKIQQDKEVILFIKTKETLFNKVQKEITRLHSYKTPEILLIPIKDASLPYLNWFSSVI